MDLEEITEQFVRAGVAPGRPNRSAWNQWRPNKIALARPWELREFQIVPRALPGNAGPLESVTVKQPPDLSLNQTDVLAKYVNDEEQLILDRLHKVPPQYPPGGSSFLGGSSL